MGDLDFKNWLKCNELVNPGEPADAEDMDSLIRKAGGGAMLTGEAPPKPWETTASMKPKIPNALNNGWRGSQRQIARRLRPITPTAKFMARGPSF